MKVAINVKKGDKILIDAPIVKNLMEEYENLLKKALGKHFNKQIHMAGQTTELYDKALNGEIATITWVDHSTSDNSMIEFVFEDGFEASTIRKAIIPIK